jgi:hypothetical protein
MDSPVIASIVLLAAQLLGFSLLALGAVLVHEAGHAVAAVLCGFRIVAVRVGPVQLKWPKSWNWKLSRNDLLSGFVAVQFRKAPGRWARWQCLAFILAGPFANFCPALLAIPLFRGETVAANIGSLFLLVSAFVGIAAFFPYRIRGNTSDGTKVFQLLFTRRKRDELLFQFSFLCRIDEVRTLSRNRQFHQAYSKAEELLAKCGAIPRMQSNAELMKRLSNLRDSLQNQLTEAENSSQEASTYQA